VQDNLRHLIDLQALDLRLLDVRAHLATFPKKLAELDARVTAARGDLEKSKAAQTATLKDRKRFELDVEQWKEKVRKYKDQLYQVKTNEAYRALQHEIQMAEAEIAKAEDRQLEQMMASEEYDRRVKAAEKTLAEVESARKNARSNLEEEQKTAEQEEAKLAAGRETIIVQVPEDLLDHYTRIAKKHGGVSLTEVRGETCSQCGVRVRPHVFQELRRGGNEELLHCETCTRILYYIEPEQGASSSDTASAPLAQSNNG
jgi:predicted  nucleic acid-binding Zn-ribbon protein